MVRYETFTSNDGRRCKALVPLSHASQLEDPMPVNCLITLGNWDYGHVVWFEEVDMGSERSTLVVPYWGDQVEMVHQLLEELANEPWWER